MGMTTIVPQAGMDWSSRFVRRWVRIPTVATALAGKPLADDGPHHFGDVAQLVRAQPS